MAHEAKPKEQRQKHGRTQSTVSIADSPLQQVNAVDPQQPVQKPKLKVVDLYEQLFSLNEPHKPGYWVEFFLLPVSQNELNRVLAAAQPLSEHASIVQTLVLGAIANLKTDKKGDLVPLNIIQNAFSVLECVISAVLSSPSPSPVQTLIGLDRVTNTLNDLSSSILALLGSSNTKAVESATQFVLQTAKILQGTQLTGLFASKNYFVAFLDIVDRYTDSAVAIDALAAVGVLTVLNVYDDDGLPVYQQRISDYVDDVVMVKMVALIQRSFRPVSTQPQTNSRWLKWLQPSSEVAEVHSPQQPQLLLTLFFFTLHNPIFCGVLAASPALVSVMEYFAPHFARINRNNEENLKSWLMATLLRHLVDSEFEKLVDEAHETCVRIEAPKLDLDTSRRAPLAGVLDLAQIGLRAGVTSKRQQPRDWELVDQFSGLLYQSCAKMVHTKTVWHRYNFVALFKFVLGLIKHIASIREHAVVPILTKLVNCIVGLCIERDLLDEDDWTYLLYSIVKIPGVFAEVAKISPLDQLPALAAATAMTNQYELQPEKPDLALILRQGKLVAGQLLVPLRPLSTHHPMLKRAAQSIASN